MKVIDYLQRSDLFKGLPGEALEELARESKIETPGPKESVFNEGFPGDFFFLLLKGSVRIFKTTYTGTETTIKIIRPEEIFAEVILFGSNVYPVSAVTIEKCEILALSRKSFFNMLEHRDARNGFIGSLFRKLRYLSDQVHHLNSLDVEDRFFRFLLHTYGKKETYTITLPKKEIAAAIGTIPETLSRLIMRLTKMEILTWEKNVLSLKKDFWEKSEFED